MRLRSAIVLGAAFLLCGCWWSGPVFYPPDAAAVQPISAGSYEMRSPEPGDKPDKGRFVRLANGAWADGVDAKGWMFFFRLPGTSRDLWIVETIIADSPDAGYGLMELAGVGWTINPLIECRGTQQIVRSAGGVVENNDPPGTDGSPDRPNSSNLSCRFDDRAALERGLLAYATAHPRLAGGTLTRIGD
jgi:predicted small lipoprotein YifL